MLNNIFIFFKKKINNAKKNILTFRTNIFFLSLWCWVYISFYFNKVINYILSFILTYASDSCIIFHPKILTKKNNVPEIIDAKLGEETITNKLKMIIAYQWDSDISESGGINVKNLLSIYPALSTSVIWIAYSFYSDKNLQTINDESIGKYTKFMFLYINDKFIYRKSLLEDGEDLLFGEIPF
jgi:hypothetical protein